MSVASLRLQVSLPLLFFLLSLLQLVAGDVLPDTPRVPPRTTSPKPLRREPDESQQRSKALIQLHSPAEADHRRTSDDPEPQGSSSGAFSLAGVAVGTLFLARNAAPREGALR
mmetsp:Transcript_90537/g.230314  ORF Transcript_90537/g.230314 Transcript_90537/m.230314 type:complete len:113 (-) Transcript_90537:106-444(-)